MAKCKRIKRKIMIFQSDVGFGVFDIEGQQKEAHCQMDYGQVMLILVCQTDIEFMITASMFDLSKLKGSTLLKCTIASI